MALPGAPRLRGPAPSEVEVNGGPEAALLGMLVMVIEDDYHLALEYSAALQRAGASILGPFPDTHLAMRALLTTRPHCVVLDLHLRDGFRFAMVATLRAGRIPVVVATGYDPDVLPGHLRRDLVILQKPVDRGELIRAVSRWHRAGAG